MAKPRPKKNPAERGLLPIQISARLTDETGEYEISGRPYTTNAGKDVHARIKKVANPTSLGHEPGANERVSVRRA